MSGLVLEPLQQRTLLEILRPVEAHGLRAIAGGDGLRAIFPALRADIFGRIAASHDENILPLELQRIAEIMRVHHPAVEGPYSLEIRNVRRRKMAGCNDHVVELLGI